MINEKFNEIDTCQKNTLSSTISEIHINFHFNKRKGKAKTNLYDIVLRFHPCNNNSYHFYDNNSSNYA